MATKVKVDAEQLRGLLNAITDVVSFFKFTVPVDGDGKNLLADISETLDASAYLVDIVWKKSVFHKDGRASVNSDDLDELVGCSEEMVEFFNRYLSADLSSKVQEFLSSLTECVDLLKGV